jgi:hypothetical protein
MTQNIKYNSINRFIKEDIIEDRIPEAFRRGEIDPNNRKVFNDIFGGGDVRQTRGRRGRSIGDKRFDNQDLINLEQGLDTFKRDKDNYNYIEWYKNIAGKLEIWNNSNPQISPSFLWHYQNDDNKIQNGNNKDFLTKVTSDRNLFDRDYLQFMYIKKYKNIFSKDVLNTEIYNRLTTKIESFNTQCKTNNIFKTIKTVDENILINTFRPIYEVIYDASLNDIISYIPIYFNNEESNIFDINDKTHRDNLRSKIYDFFRINYESNITFSKKIADGTIDYLQVFTKFIRNEYNYEMNTNLKRVLKSKSIIDLIIDADGKSIKLTKDKFIENDLIQQIINPDERNKEINTSKKIHNYYENKALNYLLKDKWSIFLEYIAQDSDKKNMTNILGAIYDYCVSKEYLEGKHITNCNNWWLLSEAIESEYNNTVSNNIQLEKLIIKFIDYIAPEGAKIGQPGLGTKLYSYLSRTNTKTFDEKIANNIIPKINLIYNLAEPYQPNITDEEVNNSKYIIGIISLLIIFITAGYVYTKKRDKKKCIQIIGGGLMLLSVYFAFSWDYILSLFDDTKQFVENIINPSSLFGGARYSSIKQKGGLQTGSTMANTFKDYFSGKKTLTDITKDVLTNTMSDQVSKKLNNYGINLGPEIITGLLGAILLFGTIFTTKSIFNQLKSYFDSGNDNDLKSLETILNNKVRSGENYSKEAALFSFNTNTGNIDTIYQDGPIAILISSGSHFGIKGIYMLVDENKKITFEIDGVVVDSLSYIENKPVQTALVLAYLIKDKHFSRLTTKTSSDNSVGEPDDYKFNFEDDGSLRLIKRQNGVDQEVESVSMVLRQQMTNDSKELEEAAEKKKQVCKKLFGEEDSPYCAKHFNSILGRAGLNMLQNLGEAITENNIIGALTSAEVNVQYEILRNLDWKLKTSNSKKILASVDEWIQILTSDNRPAVVNKGKSYENYLNNTSGSSVKLILQNMVDHINNNSRLLQEKYKVVKEQSTEIRRKKPSYGQIGKLRSQVINENNILNSPFAIPGRPGAFRYVVNPVMYGGEYNNEYNNEYNILKQSLLGNNKKLSSVTEKRIENKIEKIDELDKELDKELYDIHNQINTYTKILKSDKNARLNKIVSLEDIQDLINQYTKNSKKQTKHVATVTTLFGKMKMLLENQEIDDLVKKQKEYYFNF